MLKKRDKTKKRSNFFIFYLKKQDIMRGKITKITSILTIIIASNIYFFPKNFINELAISFSPYILLISIMLFLLNIVNIITMSSKKTKIKKDTREHTKKNIKKLKYSILIFLLGGIIFLYGTMIQSFYSTKKESQNKNDTGLKIMFSNIYYKNSHTEDILKQIKQNNPDIIAFVEFSLNHKKQIYDNIIKQYPYTNITQWSKKHAGNIVFSKYPLQDLNDQTKQGRRRYNYISIDYNKQKFYFYVVHTTAPITLEHFKNRNIQLQKFTQDIITKNTTQDKRKTIIVGDFNITPWSAYYKTSLKRLPFINITKYNIGLFSRKFSPLPILKAHIDHIFISKNIKYNSVDFFQLQGSDHKGIIINNIK